MTATTDSIVIDASAALPLVVEEPSSAVVSLRIATWRRAGLALIVPSHFWLEVTNSLLIRHRRPGRAVIEALRELDELELETVDVDRSLVLVLLDLAERHALTSYDAGYLAIAETLDALLYSADRALLAAAGSRGVSVEDDRLSETTATYERTPTWPRYGEVSAFLAKLRAEARDGRRTSVGEPLPR